MKISVVLPVHNEAGNLPLLAKELDTVCSRLGGDYEIIWVDDGSTDVSRSVLEDLASKDSHHKLIAFSRNFGQTAAMSAGITASTGDVIVPMDADMQNDPADIPRFLEKMNEGFDVVSGWRKDRKDKLITRKVPSWIANRTIAFITGCKIHDYGCSMKAYKRDLIQGVTLYGEMHRFIPAYAKWQGGRVTEIIVHHRARGSGATHYGISRTFKVILDLIVLKFLTTYMTRPMHFFGGLGFVSLFLGIIASIWSLELKFAGGISISRTPLPIIAALFFIVGVQLILMGVVAEMLMRIYYESQDKKPYQVKERKNFS